MEPSRFPLNVPFRPLPKSRLWYGITALLGVLFAVVVFVPLALLVVLPVVAYVGFVIFAAVLLAIFLVWIVLYYASMEYELRDDELSWRRGPGAGVAEIGASPVLRGEDGVSWGNYGRRAIYES